MEKRKSALIKEMRSKSATVILGKRGVTEEFVEEVKKQLERKKVIKVKALKSVLTEQSFDDIASEIAVKTNSQLLETRGYTLLLVKKNF
ncbi:MAG: YhbY family RNA-binding protein [Candidatus Freyarchaeota archaeon]